MDEESDGDEQPRRHISPGPGQYLTHDSSFISTKKPLNFQNFGSKVGRFTDKPQGCALGPGQYRNSSVSAKHNSVLKAAGTGVFKAKSRFSPIPSDEYDKPGPGNYNPFLTKDKMSPKAFANAFGVKTKRFAKDDTLPPGPGQYPLPDSCQVKDPKLSLASYKSG